MIRSTCTPIVLTAVTGTLLAWAGAQAGPLSPSVLGTLAASKTTEDVRAIQGTTDAAAPPGWTAGREASPTITDGIDPWSVAPGGASASPDYDTLKQPMNGGESTTATNPTTRPTFFDGATWAAEQPASWVATAPASFEAPPLFPDDEATWAAEWAGPGEPPTDNGPAMLGGCVTCVAGDLIEGEPLCATGYVDVFNAGCNSTPNVFGTIECGQTVCGTYGTFLSSGGSNFRDTDWYRFTLPVDASVTWTATGDAATRVFILQGSCPAVTLGTATAGACLPASITLNLAAGTYFAFVATEAFTGVTCGEQYRATLTATPCCVPATQPSDVIEGETTCSNGYIDAFNGGCNSTPNVFGTIECGQTVSGTYGTYLTSGGSNVRDTDWYQFRLPVAANVTWTATGQAATRVFILQGSCPATSLATTSAPACSPASVTVSNLAAGTYYVFVATEAFTGVPCGSRYRATLTITPCCVGPTQATDLIEGEPPCTNGYIDTFNGGCNSTPNVFGRIDCGLTVAGTYGTYLTSGGANVRDTDWYQFTITQTSSVTWSAVGEARTRLFILQGTCPAVSIATTVADACQTATITIPNLAPGTYNAFVATDAFSGVACGSRYRATLETTPCCPVGCRPGDRAEGEVACFTNYIDTFNAGCNSTPNIFGSISCGETICGTYGTYLNGTSNFRDTDWYRFVLTSTQTVSLIATGEARTRLFLMRGTCPASSLGTIAGDPCVPVTLTVPNLAAGTYYAFVGTDAFTGVPCGSRYRVTLSGSGCRCPADVDDGSGTGMPDGGVTIDDLLYYLFLFQQGLISADIDDGSGTGTPDGGVTIDDLLYFLLRFAGGC